MPARICPDCARQGTNPIHHGKHQRCDTHRAQREQTRDTKRGGTTQRGYGTLHQQLRDKLITTYRPGQPCAIGGEPLTLPAAQLDLAHDHVNGGYLGLACRPHNRGEPGKR